jgi:putative endonuclease
MAKHIDLGRLGEEIALEYLQRKGYRIHATNWRYGKIEIDIIASDKEYLVIVEVKTRESDDVAEPSESVTKAKQKKLIKAANEYILQRNIMTETRFDIISIVFTEGEPQTEHIENAFYPTI